jgi:hypothetical protein
MFFDQVMEAISAVSSEFSMLNQANSLPKIPFNFETAMGSSVANSYAFGLPPMSLGSTNSGAVNTSSGSTKYNETLLNSFHYISIEPVYMTTNEAADANWLSPKKVKAELFNDIIKAITSAGRTYGGVSLNSPYVFAIQRRLFMESFSNDYQDSFFQEAGATLTKQNIFSSRGQYYGAANEASWEQLRRQAEKDAGTSGMLESLSGFFNKAKSADFDILKSGVGAQLLRGARIDLPKIWGNSSWGFNNSFEIKLISPSASTYDILRFIMLPVYILMMCACPISRDKGDTYLPSPFVAVTLPGFWKYSLCGIRDLSITWGGDTASFAPSQLPLITDISITLEPLKTTVETLFDGANTSSGDNPHIANTLSRIKDVSPTRGKTLRWFNQGQTTSSESSQSDAQRGTEQTIPSTEPVEKTNPFSDAHNKSVANRLSEVS